MDKERLLAINDLLAQGPRPPLLPPPDERRRLREIWGITIEEVASALGQEPDAMAEWEAGRITAGPADTYAYLRLLSGMRERMPLAYEPDWAALRPPSPSAVHASHISNGLANKESVPVGVKAAHRGAAWTAEARDYLRERFLAGDDIAQLAQALGRSEKSLRWQLWHLNLAPRPASDACPSAPAPEPPLPKAYTVEEKRKSHPNAYVRWTPEDEARLADRCAEGASLDELSGEFGRNLGAIASRLIKIGAAGRALEEAENYGG